MTIKCPFCTKTPIAVRKNVYACCGYQSTAEGWGKLYGHMKALSLMALVGKQVSHLVTNRPMCDHLKVEAFDKIRTAAGLESDPSLAPKLCEACEEVNLETHHQ